MTNLPRIQGMTAVGTPTETARYYDLNFASVGVSTQTGTTYTFRPTDSGGWVRFTSSSPVTATIAPFSSVEFGLGVVIMVEQAGSAPVTVASGAGVTIYGLATTTSQYTVLRLVNVAKNEWNITGEGAGEAAGSTINVLDYGAVGDGVTDDTAAIQSAIEALKLAVYAYSGGAWNANMSTTILLFPPGAYLVAGSLDLQNIQNGAWTLSGYGAVVKATCAGRTVFDLLGSRFFRIEGIQLIGDATLSPAIGFQPGRHSATSGGSPYSASSQFNFTDVGTDGIFTRCALYALQCETDTYTNCRFWNNKASAEGPGVIIDGYNSSSYGAITDFIATTQPTNTIESCVMHTFVGGSLFAKTGSAFITIEANIIKTVNLYVVSYDAAGYRIISASGIVYDINWDVHTETAGLTATIEVARLSSGIVTFHELTIRDIIASSTATALLKLGTNVTSIVVASGFAEHGTNYPQNTAPPFNSETVEWNGLVQGMPYSWVTGGDADYNIGSASFGNTKWRIETGTAFTSSHLYTLPDMRTLPLGARKVITDAIGAITPINNLAVLPGGIATINGKSTWRKHNPGGDVTFYANQPASRWSAPPETGDIYTTGTFSKSADTALATVTGMQFTVGASKSYKFSVRLFCTVSAAGGSKVAIAGTVTVGSVIYSVRAYNITGSTLLYAGTATSLTTAFGGITGTDHYVEIDGVILTGASGGTLLAQFAQNVASGSSSVLPLSTFTIQEVLQ